ncbi:MAG: 50S ribosomal protein L25 [Candidatus Magasanikbacteria bacterium]|nr:50S ribosomal protein L25 [Candidatus Magasanikbacteria bacterium]
MGKELKLEALTRASEKTAELRSEGFVPAVVYGAGMEVKSLKVKSYDLNTTFAEAGESALINLVIDGKTTLKVIIKDIQKDPIKRNIIHADFHLVDMAKKIEVEIPFTFTGEARAVKELGGTLLKNKEFIHARCLPGDLIDHVIVDLSPLVTFEDMIRVSDLVLPKGVEVIDHESDPVITVEMPRTVAQQQALEGSTPVVAAPVEEKKEAPKTDKK